MERYRGMERRTGADRRRNVERRNGLAVLMAGCSKCDRIAPSPAEMHSEGWLIVADDFGLVSITCPAHGEDAQGADPDLPDCIVFPDDHK
jgi:hypothetical protein